MKKYILLAAAALLSAGAFAQSTSDLLKDLEEKDVTNEKKIKSKSEKEWDTFDGSILCNYGYGYQNLRNPGFSLSTKYSDEIFLTLGEFIYSPVKRFALSAGLQLRWNSYGTTTEGFSVGTDNQVSVIPVVAGVDRNISKINLTSLAVPLGVRARIGIFSLRAGADLLYRYRRNVVNSSVTGNMTTETRWKKVGAKKFGWDVTTSVEVFGLGFYYRFCPDSIFPENGMDLSSHTVGLCYTIF